MGIVTSHPHHEEIYKELSEGLIHRFFTEIPKISPDASYRLELIILSVVMQMIMQKHTDSDRCVEFIKKCHDEVTLRSGLFVEDLSEELASVNPDLDIGFRDAAWGYVLETSQEIYSLVGSEIGIVEVH